VVSGIQTSNLTYIMHCHYQLARGYKLERKVLASVALSNQINLSLNLLLKTETQVTLVSRFHHAFAVF